MTKSLTINIDRQAQDKEKGTRMLEHNVILKPRRVPRLEHRAVG